eukprot:2755386-Rhodomonas_salina.1
MSSTELRHAGVTYRRTCWLSRRCLPYPPPAIPSRYPLTTAPLPPYYSTAIPCYPPTSAPVSPYYSPPIPLPVPRYPPTTAPLSPTTALLPPNSDPLFPY